MKRSYSIGAGWVVWAVFSLLLAGAVPHHHHHRTICLFGACCGTEESGGCGGASSEEDNCVGRTTYLPESGSEERFRAVSSDVSGVSSSDFYDLSPERISVSAVAERAAVRRSFPDLPARCSVAHAVACGRRAPPEAFV